MSDFVPQPFSQALSEFAWVTPRELKALQAASYTTVGDVLLRVPRRYEDRRCTKPINALLSGETASLQLHVYSAGWRFSYKRYFEVSAGAEGEPYGPRGHESLRLWQGKRVCR